MTARRIVSTLFVLLVSLHIVHAQREGSGTAMGPVPAVVATASNERVRYVSMGEIKQTRLQIFAPMGMQIFDTDFRLGNLIDWHLRDQQGSSLSEGSYLYLITVKDFSDRVTQRFGTVVLDGEEVYLEQTSRGELSEPQSSALEANRQSEVLASVDRIGAAGRSRSTSESSPSVATANGGGSPGSSTISEPTTGGENIGGTGTQNFLAKWLDNAGTLGDSVLFQSASSRIGLGTTTPGAKFHVVGTQGSIGGGTFQLDTSTLFSGFTAAYPAFEIINTNATNNNVSLFQFADAPSGAAHAGIGAVNTNHANDWGDLFFFSKAAADGYQVRMGVFNGNVGIATTNPGSRLDVVGDVNTSTLYKLGGSRILGVGSGGSSTYAGLSAGPVDTGSGNSFLGNGAGFNNTTGGLNTYIGASAAFFNKDGEHNTFVGGFAGFKNVNGSNNSFYGYNAGRENTAGGGGILSSGNSFFGTDSGAANTIGKRNSFFGHESGLKNLDADGNSFFGTTAGKENTSGDSNSFFGFQAGLDNKLGNDNSFFGVNAGLHTTSGDNAFFGFRAGSNNSSGASNTFVGVDAGKTNTAESNNTMLGFEADAACEVDHATAIGYKAKVTRSNALVLGCISGCTSPNNEATNVGIGIGSPLARLHVVANSTSAADNTATFGAPNIGAHLSHIHYGTAGSWFIRSASATGRVVLQDTGGNVGIGSPSPGAKLEVSGGDAAITTQGNGLILRATNGANCYRVTVDNAGALSTTAVACP